MTRLRKVLEKYLLVVLPIEAMIDKALRLLQARRVEKLNPGRFNVIGDHGTYFVVVRNGVATCSCPGFRNRGRCSHASAVTIMLGRSKSATRNSR
jgi:hypothetical protein